MIRIDKEIPKHCAECKLMVVHKETDFYPTFLCKLVWRELDHENVCKKRAEFCQLEDVEPAEVEMEGGGSSWWYVCGDCHGAIDKWDNYCKHCGRPVKKEEKNGGKQKKERTDD
ncbi:MAG: hypothetical protein J6Y48_06130 [Clostridia bacterium]|nr:hypothetical protein [Clostridia bacterium]